MHSKTKKPAIRRSLAIFSAIIPVTAPSLSWAQGLEWVTLTTPPQEQSEPIFQSAQDESPITPPLWEIITPDPALEENGYSTNLSWELVSPEDLLAPELEHKPEDDVKSISELEKLIRTITPTSKDYLPLLRLGPAVPTANQVPDQEAQVSFFQLAPMAGGGDAGGTGNQNYVGRLDLGINDQLQISAFYSEADDPLFAAVRINGQLANPSNFWQSYGGALQWQLLNQQGWKLGFAGSLEGWNVGSGGSLGRGQVSQSGSPNIFNNSGQRVYTNNTVGSLALPLSWQASKTVELTFTPGVSFLPPTQGTGQGGAGTFYGTNITVGAGVAWKPSTQVTLFGSGVLPLGPGSNSFNSELAFQKVPILTGGLNYALNPRIGLEAALTNGFGGTPATAVLALPSANQLMYTARMVWTPQAMDTPQLAFNKRSRSLTLGGVSVSTALVPPDGTINLWANADDKGNVFGQVGWSASNDFQFILFDAGAFQQVSPITPLVSTYANNGGFNQRFGGKAVFLQQLRGAPLTASGAITLGRNYDASSFQGYLYAEAIGTWETNDWLALNLNPKLAWSGVDTPFGIGVSANVQLGSSFQLIPEINAVATDVGSSNATLSLRWLARDTTALDVYVSNAAGVYDMGQLLRDDSARVGAKFTIQL